MNEIGLFFFLFYSISFDNFILRLLVRSSLLLLLFEKNKVSKCDALNGIVLGEDNYMYE